MKIGQYLVTTWTNVCGLLFWATLYIERLNTYTVFSCKAELRKGLRDGESAKKVRRCYPGKFLKICFQNPSFWCHEHQKLVYVGMKYGTVKRGITE